METGSCLIYDGTFEGFMTAVATGLEKQLRVARITAKPVPQGGLFVSERQIAPNRQLAMTFWDAIGNRGSGLQRLVYFSFLAAGDGKELAIFNYLKCLLQQEGETEQQCEAEQHSRLAIRNRLEAWATQVEGEKLAIESSLAFNDGASGIPCGLIAPRHEVLPLLSRYFRLRFGNSPWIVFDTRRQYGLKSENGTVAVIRHCPGVRDAILRGAQTESHLMGSSLQRAYRTAV